MASTSVALSPLTAISPLDGRYWSQLNGLSAYFSEFSLIKYRIYVEIEYFIALCQLPVPQLAKFEHAGFGVMRGWAAEFSLADAEAVKASEKITNHDVKAVEYWIKTKFDEQESRQPGGWAPYKEFIHFGLTSQDINNTAIPLALRKFIDDEYLPALTGLIGALQQNADEWGNTPMLARTHGQAATPTRVGRELLVFVERLGRQLHLLRSVPHAAKFGGATGGFNAHRVAYPTIDWPAFADGFVEELGLTRERHTTQISHYDSLGALCDSVKRINTILIDMARDFWQYISLDYFKQRIVATEVGSSAMPHKVNPIDFENAEGNLGMANAVFEHLSAKLPVSRMQRDLTDSTVLRNLGVPFAHTILSFKSLRRALGKLIINNEQLKHDLDEHWIVVAEAFQTVLRRESYPEPYEALKSLTRTGQQITHEVMNAFVDTLAVSDSVKAELKAITPHNYA
eukprot:TRINITY_DN2144_c0_g1_i2.p1 TRINITY_DN2144_c0_g1~~TRINITY_DN2144_c0_g1_i2.p1  ORF type:complete len:456 (-),score=144.63 TRINITY_DN2144_c0_g1_i2:44-1411(-)